MDRLPSLLQDNCDCGFNVTGKRGGAHSCREDQEGVRTEPSQSSVRRRKEGATEDGTTPVVRGTTFTKETRNDS